MRHVFTAMIAASLLFVSTTAFGAVCVEVDEERDNLRPAERQAVKTIVEDTLRKENVEVSQRDCETTYTIYSLRLGNSITANISGPNGSQKQKARSLDELPETYEQITVSVLTGDDSQMAGTTRHNVTSRQSAPRRVRADSIYYARLGYGLITGGDVATGPAFGFGWRYELDNMGIDISALNFTISDSKTDAASFSLLRLGALYFFDPVANSTAYLNGGLSWGWTVTEFEENDVTRTYEDNGLQGEIGVGYEFMRTSTIRLFVEANALLPFYTVDYDGSYWDEGANADEEDSRWAPVFNISLGVGYDPNPSTIVEVYD